MSILIQKYPKKYFGINETTNIFTGDATPFDVVNEYYRIPSVVNIPGESWVAVNTGYVPLETQPTDDFELHICDDNGSSLQKLNLVIGTPGDPSSKPARDVVVWLNYPNVRGCYYVNSAWLGKVFHIKKGKYISTTANAPRLNEISSNYDFVNNVEQYINDTIDSNNINVTYSDNRSYIVEKKIVNDKPIYRNSAVNAEYASNATKLIDILITDDEVATHYLFDRGERIYIQWIQVQGTGKINLGTFGTAIFGTLLYKIENLKYTLINPSDIIFDNKANVIYYNSSSEAIITGIVFYFK